MSQTMPRLEIFARWLDRVLHAPIGNAIARAGHLTLADAQATRTHWFARFLADLFLPRRVRACGCGAPVYFARGFTRDFETGDPHSCCDPYRRKRQQ